MYYRIIVKQAGQFIFRTSRLHDDMQLLRALRVFPESGLEIEVLKVVDGAGAIMSNAQVAALVAETQALLATLPINVVATFGDDTPSEND